MTRPDRPDPSAPAATRYTSLLTGPSPTFVSYDPSVLDDGARTFWASVARICSLHVAGSPAAPGAEAAAGEELL